MDLGASGNVLVLTSVTRKDTGIYQCRPQDVDAASEVRGEMQLTVHCEDTKACSTPKSNEHRPASFLTLFSCWLFQSWTRSWLCRKTQNSCSGEKI